MQNVLMSAINPVVLNMMSFDFKKASPSQIEEKASNTKAIEEEFFEVVDFGSGPQDCTQGYPFTGTESACSKYIDEHQVIRPNGEGRFAMQNVLDTEPLENEQVTYTLSESGTAAIETSQTNFVDMIKDELLVYAASHNIKVAKSWTKAKIIAALSAN